MCSVSQQKAMLRDLWAFLIRSPFRERSPDGTSDFSLAHFTLAEDSLTDVLSETLVLAVSGDTAVSSSTIADALGFLPKDSFFKSLVQFVFASDEQIHLAAFSATRQVIHAFLLYDSDFAASVRTSHLIISTHRAPVSDMHAGSQCSIIQCPCPVSFGWLCSLG